jgi:hypothetical protein
MRRPNLNPATNVYRLRKVPPPPAGLAKAEADWWTAILNEHAIEGHAALLLLENMLRQHTHARMCDEQIARDGLMIEVKGRKRPHPLLREAAVARNSFLSCMRALGLDVGPKQ